MKITTEEKVFVSRRRKAIAASKKVIVVDVQPEYNKAIYFSFEKFVEFLADKTVLYFYNGDISGLSDDTYEDIKNWLHEQTDYSLFKMDEEGDLNYDTDPFQHFKFVDKGYAFFRGWMDYGVDEDIIIDTIKYMLKNKINDSRDIPEDDFKKLTGEHPDECEFFDDAIYMPDINLKKLKRDFNNATLVGGGENECLAEVEILLKALGMKYKINRKFIY